MSTLIELFDATDAIADVVAGLAMQVDRIVYVGSDEAELQAHLARYRRVFAAHGVSLRLTYRIAPHGDVNALCRMLETIFAEDDTVIMDTVGGDDYALLAAGIIAERCAPPRFSLCRTNPTTGDVTVVFGDPPQLRPNVPLFLTVEESLSIYGGIVAPRNEQTAFTDFYAWEWDDDFCRDFDTLWQLCVKHPEPWRNTVTLLQTIVKSGAPAGSSTSYTTLGTSFSDAVRRIQPGKTPLSNNLVDTLRRRGILTEYVQSYSVVRVTFKNDRLAACLLSFGLIMEVYVYRQCCLLKDDRNQPYFSDVKTGVTIKWGDDADAFIRANGYGNSYDTVDTVNEIDVIAMRGNAPLFISCKTGKFNEEEIYKLTVVSERFGGDNGKRALFYLHDEPGKAMLAKTERAHKQNIFLRKITADSQANLDLLYEFANVQ